jgi:hypothetical protein
LASQVSDSGLVRWMHLPWAHSLRLSDE